MSGLVSIILTTLNSARFLSQSVESCLSQSYDHLELLVVDGGSTDETPEILQEYDDSRIRIIHQTNNEGKLPGAINLGMAHARGDYLTWTQDDCWYEPDAIELMIRFLETNPTIGLVYADYWLVDSLHGKEEFKYRPVSETDQLLSEDVIQQCFLFRRIVYEMVGPQDPRYYSVHEVPWRLKVAAQFQIAPLHIPLQYYRLHPDSLTGRYGGYTEQRKMQRALLSERHIDKLEYRHRLASIDINQAYDAFVLRGDYGSFRRFAATACLKDSAHLKNRGLWRLLALSFSPSRDRQRRTMHEAWQLSQNECQSVLLKAFRESFPNRSVPDVTR